jgi:NAD(P)-dependent dehydrogenase (short-subunit alcohol dehydrogenase family)
VIVITGAGGSLGPHVARRLADDYHELALVDTDLARLAGLPGSHHAVDLLDAGAAREFAASLDGVTGVVHLVGGWKGGPIESSLEHWSLLHDLLVRTLQNTSLAFLPALRESGRGRLVIISASASQKPTATNAAYAAAKAAAEAWVRALADELAGTGATANILAVNAIVTPEMREKNPDKAYATFTDARDMAEAIVFLLSDAAKAMNGQRFALHP